MPASLSKYLNHLTSGELMFEDISSQPLYWNIVLHDETPLWEPFNYTGEDRQDHPFSIISKLNREGVRKRCIPDVQ
jgi:hypothetical protein